MPYTPPAGNAVTFNFFGGYLPPFGTFVPFQFGIIPPPPPPPPAGSAQLPTGFRIARIEDEDWLWMPRRRFAPPFVAALGPISLRHNSPLRFMPGDEEWIAPRPLQIRFQPPSRRRRPVMFTIT